MNKTLDQTKANKPSFKETWGNLISYCSKYSAAIVVALLCAIAGAVLTIIGPDKITAITDEITLGLVGEMNLDAIAKITGILIAMYAASFILTYTQALIMSTITQTISKNLRTDISKKINRLPLNYFDTTSHGDILSRVTNDVDRISETLSESVASLLSSAVLFFGSLIMMFRTNSLMAITAVLSSLIGFVFMIIIVSKSQGYFTKQQEYVGEINGHIEEVYSGHSVVKAYNASKKMNVEYDRINDNLFNVSWKAQFMSGLMMPIMSFISNFSYVAVCVVGAILVMNGSISFGVIIGFTLYVSLFSQPLTTIATSVSGLQQTAAASYRVFDLLNKEELSDESTKLRQLDTIQGEIEFDHVAFSYEPNEPIINDFSSVVAPGQKVAIVGPTGAGKTTLVNLLMRFYETNSGDIKIDQKSIKDMTREEVHEHFCMVLQDTWLFEGSIRDNMIYNQKGISDEQVVQAAKAAGIHHFITTLPDGYDTILNEDASLSQGQRQLITIARAMLQDAPMLILDEATSSVDTRTEVLIQSAMDQLMEGRTSIVIAHRLSTIKNADLILVLKDGDIIETGNHTSLMSQGGFYADLYNSQFEE